MINLLGDPDREVFSIIAGRLINEGAAIVPALEKAWEQPSDGLQQERIENLSLSRARAWCVRRLRI